MGVSTLYLFGSVDLGSKPTSPYFLTQIGRMQMILDYHDDWLRVKEDYRYYAMIRSRFEKFIKTQQDKWKEFGFGH
jgi:hypothetical protein